MADRSTISEYGSGAALGTGQGLLYLFPNAVGNVAVWDSYLKGSPRLSPEYFDAAKQAGLGDLDLRNMKAPLLQAGQEGFSSHYTFNLGNSATMAEVDLLRSEYGKLHDLELDLQGKGYSRGVYNFLDGSGSFNPDLQYTTRSWWEGSTRHLDEVKAQYRLGSSAAGQLDNYGSAVSEINLANENYRFAGNGLRVLGVAGTIYDGYVTYEDIDQRIAAGDLDGAGLSAAEFGGRWAGGLALGTQGALYLGGLGMT